MTCGTGKSSICSAVRSKMCSWRGVLTTSATSTTCGTDKSLICSSSGGTGASTISPVRNRVHDLRQGLTDSLLHDLPCVHRHTALCAITEAAILLAAFQRAACESIDPLDDTCDARWISLISNTMRHVFDSLNQRDT